MARLRPCRRVLLHAGVVAEERQDEHAHAVPWLDAGTGEPAQRAASVPPIAGGSHAEEGLGQRATKELREPAGEAEVARNAPPGRLRGALAALSLGQMALGLLLTGLVVVLGVGATAWLEDRITSNQEVLENARFVRQVAFDAEATVQPFAGLALSGAQLAGLDLSCRVLDAGARNFYGARAFHAFRPGSPCADLFGSDLSGALLREANLSGADLREANLSGADFTDAILVSSNPIAADFSDAILTGADLSDANLIRADLSGADLTGANLSEALLFDADLSDAELGEVCFDVNTQWPEEFDPPADPDCSDWL